MSDPRYPGDPALPKARFKRQRGRRGPSFLVITAIGGVVLVFATLCCFSGLLVSLVEKAVVGMDVPIGVEAPRSGERFTEEQLLGGERQQVLPVLSGLPPLPDEGSPVVDPGARPDAGVGAPPIRPVSEPTRPAPRQRGPSESELFGVQ